MYCPGWLYGVIVIYYSRNVYVAPQGEDPGISSGLPDALIFARLMDQCAFLKENKSTAVVPVLGEG